jgi:hypothetical protein
MVSRATSAKKFERALELLNRLPKQDFPYAEATQLMLDLPPDRDNDNQEIFRLAMAGDCERHSMAVGSDDFASMIVRFWQHIPPALALDAIHQVLDAAKHREGSGVTLNAASGSLGFTAEYDYRVFELLPVLRQLDDDEADKILKDSQQAQIHLKQFPNGIQSIDPTITDPPRKRVSRGKALGDRSALRTRWTRFSKQTRPESSRLAAWPRTILARRLRQPPPCPSRLAHSGGRTFPALRPISQLLARR